jgi:xanthine/CO dehydrogenase XdhC/CoxF family maturation factor
MRDVRRDAWRDAWDALDRVTRAGDEGALVTITETRGSAYQREGTKLIFLEKAEPIGTISGGCLEADLFEHCRRQIAKGEAAIVTYQNGTERDLLFGTGSGCEGTIEMLIEPLALWRMKEARELVAAIRRAIDEGRRLAVATVLRRGEEPTLLRARLVVDSAGATLGEIGEIANAALRERLVAEASASIAGDARRPSHKTEIVAGDARYEALVDVVTPAPRLVVFGAGEDARPLVAIAAATGMRVTVVDWRRELLQSKRLPDAESLIEQRPEDFPGEVSLAGSPAVMLMSHHYLADRAVLERLVADATPVSYLGVLGPRARTARLLGEVGAASPQAKARVAEVRTPAGLDIGADTPEEIALSIVAEMLAVRRHASGRPLREIKRDVSRDVSREVSRDVSKEGP